MSNEKWLKITNMLPNNRDKLFNYFIFYFKHIFVFHLSSLTSNQNKAIGIHGWFFPSFNLILLLFFNINILLDIHKWYNSVKVMNMKKSMLRKSAFLSFKHWPSTCFFCFAFKNLFYNFFPYLLTIKFVLFQTHY